jgi:hypothetical protein
MKNLESTVGNLESDHKEGFDEVGRFWHRQVGLPKSISEIP